MPIGINAARKTVELYFENQFAKRLDLKKVSGKDEFRGLDLYSKNQGWGAEIKGSSYDSGGVIRERQLEKNLELPVPIFYGFGHHSWSSRGKMGKMSNAFSVNSVRAKLDVRGLYLFPIELIKQFYLTGNIIQNKRLGDGFILMKEHHAKSILNKEEKIWEQMQLNPNNFEYCQINEINIFENINSPHKIFIK